MNVVKKSEAVTKTRQSNFELLRIICMIFIIAHHFSVHSLLPEGVSEINKFIHDAFAIGGKVAVNVFVLISGYFMIKSEFKMKKIISLIFQTLFYSFAIYLIMCVSGFYTFSFKESISHLLGFYSKYWFMTNYLILYAISPFLNKIIHNSSKKSLTLLCLFAILLQTQILRVDLGNLVWFCTIYLIAGYIRIYPNRLTNNFTFSFVISSIFFIEILLCYTLLGINLWGMTNLICLIWSITLFCTFKNIKIKNNKIINFISSITLGIYLIHDNSLIRPLLWGKWFNVNYHSLHNNFWIFAICSVVIVFIVCSIIEILRSLLEKLIVNSIQKSSKKKLQKRT